MILLDWFLQLSFSITNSSLNTPSVKASKSSHQPTGIPPHLLDFPAEKVHWKIQCVLCTSTQMVNNLSVMQETWVWPLGREDRLEKGMATHSSILAWIIPWTEESGGLQSMGRKGSDCTEQITLSLSQNINSKDSVTIISVTLANFCFPVQNTAQN